jgi:hypothetical protein
MLWDTPLLVLPHSLRFSVDTILVPLHATCVAAVLSSNRTLTRALSLTLESPSETLQLD